MNVANRPLESGSIRFLTGPLAGSIFQISKPIITFGREPDNDIVISDPTVSRQHARLVNNAGQWSIEKLAPQNVITVNQHNVQQAVIADCDPGRRNWGIPVIRLRDYQAAPQWLRTGAGSFRRSGRCDREADDQKSSQKADAKLPFSP